MVFPAVGALIVTGAGTAHASDLYGAIAVGYTPESHATGVGVAVDYPSQDAADEAAKQACSVDRCLIMARVHNECGSVSEVDVWATWTNAVEPLYSTGRGPTAAAAEKVAMDEGNRLLSFPSNTAFFAFGMARIVKPLFILDTICTANAG